MTAPPSSLFRRWVHVREEDTDEAKVYRPFGTDLPPARGRRGLEFREDGTFVEYMLGADDRPEGRPGRWRAEAEDRLTVERPQADAAPETLEILAVAGDKLEIRH